MCRVAVSDTDPDCQARGGSNSQSGHSPPVVVCLADLQHDSFWRQDGSDVTFCANPVCGQVGFVSSVLLKSVLFANPIRSLFCRPGVQTSRTCDPPRKHSLVAHCSVTIPDRKSLVELAVKNDEDGLS